MEYIEKSRKMVDFNPIKVIITLHVNGLKTAIKIQVLSYCTKKQHKVCNIYKKTL